MRFMYSSVPTKQRYIAREEATSSTRPDRAGRGIIDSLRLAKTSKIIKSNRHPNTTMPTKPYPEVPHLHVFWTSPGIVTPPLPWAACFNVSRGDWMGLLAPCTRKVTLLTKRHRRLSAAVQDFHPVLQTKTPSVSLLGVIFFPREHTCCREAAWGGPAHAVCCLTAVLLSSQTCEWQNLPKQNHTESQNSRGWKGPLWVI